MRRVRHTDRLGRVGARVHAALGRGEEAREIVLNIFCGKLA
jgi:hypothetical protein